MALIILPLLGLFETPRRLPGSIAESVLGKQGSASAMAGAAAASPSTKG
jgi:ubiquinol-cytochrome c reductase cytochrome b subunit